jgi:DNA-binding MarR family transcriptional regulator
LNNIEPYIARLAPLLPQLVLAYQHRAGEIPAVLQGASQLGQRHVGMLITLAMSGPLSVSELAGRTEMTVAHASLVVGELAKAGLVEREHDERDRRRIIVSLSETARPAVAEMRRHNAEPVISFLRQLEQSHAERFISDLTLLLAHLRDAPPPLAGAGPGRTPATKGGRRQDGGQHRSASASGQPQ